MTCKIGRIGSQHKKGYESLAINLLRFTTSQSLTGTFSIKNCSKMIKWGSKYQISLVFEWTLLK
jgi:hypothetical protein